MNIIETGLQFNGLRNRTLTRLIVLHHSASPDVPAAEIHAWHLARGWAGIGYHFVIREYGNIERGRPMEAIGAHAGPGVNGYSIGICLCGDFMKEVPGAAQIKALLQLLAWLDEYYGSATGEGMAIKLHREVAATVCPGNLFPVEKISRLHRQAASTERRNNVDDWKNQLMREARSIGLIQEEHDPDEGAPKWFVLAVAIHVLDSIKNGGKELEG